MGALHLTYDENATTLKVVGIDYSAFGAPLSGRSFNASGIRYGFNGQEKDNEIYGNGNHLSFNDYGYDPRLGRRWRVDPHSGNYPSMSGYSSFANNPIINLDPDGKDIVYFNTQGLESHRVKSNTEFKTFIMGSAKAGDPKISLVGWKEVAMPKIINERPTTNEKGQEIIESTTGTEYQENDYVIAARTGYFNQAKNAGNLNLYTEGGNAIPKEAVQAIPDLDPTLVKAIALQESHLGVLGDKDIMTANNGGDWPKGEKMKPEYGLAKDAKLNVTNSLYFGIRILATKGFRGGIDGKGGYKFQGWNKAAGAYNSTAGTPNYKEHVESMQNNSGTPSCTDYTDECK